MEEPGVDEVVRVRGGWVLDAGHSEKELIEFGLKRVVRGNGQQGEEWVRTTHPCRRMFAGNKG